MNKHLLQYIFRRFRPKSVICLDPVAWVKERHTLRPIDRFTLPLSFYYNQSANSTYWQSCSAKPSSCCVISQYIYLHSVVKQKYHYVKTETCTTERNSKYTKQ